MYVGTLYRGMLLPLESTDNGLVPGSPLEAPAKTKGAVELITDPREFFVPHSEEFRAFLDRLVKGRGFLDWDVQRLYAEANKLRNGHDFREAVFYYEAALQIENDPRIRNELYFGLAGCYQRTGMGEAEGQIMEFLSSNGSKRSRIIFGEKGF